MADLSTLAAAPPAWPYYQHTPADNASARALSGMARAVDAHFSDEAWMSRDIPLTVPVRVLEQYCRRERWPVAEILEELLGTGRWTREGDLLVCAWLLPEYERQRAIASKRSTSGKKGAAARLADAGGTEEQKPTPASTGQANAAAPAALAEHSPAGAKQIEIEELPQCSESTGGSSLEEEDASAREPAAVPSGAAGSRPSEVIAATDASAVAARASALLDALVEDVALADRKAVRERLRAQLGELGRGAVRRRLPDGRVPGDRHWALVVALVERVSRRDGRDAAIALLAQHEALRSAGPVRWRALDYGGQRARVILDAVHPNIRRQVLAGMDGALETTHGRLREAILAGLPVTNSKRTA